MLFYILQEQVDNSTWLDLYTSDLCMLKKMIIALKRKNINKKYRIVRVYR